MKTVIFQPSTFRFGRPGFIECASCFEDNTDYTIWEGGVNDMDKWDNNTPPLVRYFLLSTRQDAPRYFTTIGLTLRVFWKTAKGVWKEFWKESLRSRKRMIACGSACTLAILQVWLRIGTCSSSTFILIGLANPVQVLWIAVVPSGNRSKNFIPM